MKFCNHFTRRSGHLILIEPQAQKNTDIFTSAMRYIRKVMSGEEKTSYRMSKKGAEKASERGA
jgi:hypothetical protein